MNNIMKAIVALVMVCCVFSSIPIESHASPILSGTVTASKLNLREKATASSARLGSIPKGSIIHVYSLTNNGWSETWFNKKKAFVQTKYIKLSPQISFKKDKKKVYTYWESGSIGTQRYLQKIKGKNVWEAQGNGYHISYIEDETKNGLYYETSDGGRKLVIPFPLVSGKTWYDGSRQINIITSLTKTVKTPAGTFTNAIEIKSGSLTFYFARNHAHIKTINNNRVITLLKTISYRK
ncbi:SH3 domain-containing protein [Peribacillus sp. SCS-155]|uniref:SH3 domain-containing protein n=1 Tax=Peribacillus sedimenti TaxID=3115297 RepID=UPI003905B8B4